MKRLFLLCLLSGFAKAQGPDFPLFMWEMVGQDQLRTEAFKYVKTGNEEVDANVMWAFEKFNAFTTPVKAIDKNKDENFDYFKGNKNISVLQINHFLFEGEQGDFYATRFRVCNAIKKPVVGEKFYDVVDFSFDDFARKKEKTLIIGTDKTSHLIANRALTFTMMYCALLKNFAHMEGSPRKAAKALEDKKEELKKQYKGNTVLIPSELLANGISKEAFAGLKYKYEFMSSDKITELIKSGKGKGYSQFIMVKESTWFDNLYIIDLETGDLHDYASAGGSTFSNNYDYAGDKRVKTLIGNIGTCKY